jgi:hypothetical protein
MVYYSSTHATKEAADAAAALYMREYHPAGYGTTTRVHQDVSGRWVMNAERYRSCD